MYRCRRPWTPRPSRTCRRRCSAGSIAKGRSRDELHPTKRPPFQQVWFRLSERIGDAPELHRALLAYASDFHLIGTATFPHAISYYQPNVQMASLDHAMWFHRPFRVDDWLLYSCDSPSASSARGFARGMIYDRDGRLVASTAQEGLMRVLPEQQSVMDRKSGQSLQRDVAAKPAADASPATAQERG